MAVSLLDTHAELVFLRLIVAKMWAKLPQAERNALYEQANKEAFDAVNVPDARLAVAPAAKAFFAGSGVE